MVRSRQRSFTQKQEKVRKRAFRKSSRRDLAEFWSKMPWEVEMETDSAEEETAIPEEVMDELFEDFDEVDLEIIDDDLHEMDREVVANDYNLIVPVNLGLEPSFEDPSAVVFASVFIGRLPFPADYFHYFLINIPYFLFRIHLEKITGTTQTFFRIKVAEFILSQPIFLAGIIIIAQAGEKTGVSLTICRQASFNHPGPSKNFMVRFIKNHFHGHALLRPEKIYPFLKARKNTVVKPVGRKITEFSQ